MSWYGIIRKKKTSIKSAKKIETEREVNYMNKHKLILMKGISCAGKSVIVERLKVDEDAIILKNMSREITLRSKISHRGVCVSYPDMPYLGIWHWPKTDAPYVCIEPWYGVNDGREVKADISEKRGIQHLNEGETFEFSWIAEIKWFMVKYND